MLRPAALIALTLTAGTAAAQLAPRGATDSAVSPDGRWKAWIKTEPGTAGASGNQPGSLWITDTRTGRERLLFRGRETRDPRTSTAAIDTPVFSLDGGFVYVNADAYATSSAVHQIAVATGREHYVADGGLVGIIRSGPWRGYLLIQQHRYRTSGGSWDPVVVYRPNGRQIALVPGSGSDDGRRSTDRWLRSKGWTAS